VFEGDTLEDQFEKFINLGDDRNIVEVYVAGACVKRGNVFTGETQQTFRMRRPAAPDVTVIRMVVQ
jgi:hypothetical protein